MYHYLVAFCKVPVQNKKGGKVQKNSLCHRTEPPPPPPLKGAAVHRLLKKEFNRSWRKQFLVQKWGYGKKDSNCYNISESLVKIPQE